MTLNCMSCKINTQGRIYIILFYMDQMVNYPEELPNTLN